MGFPEGGFSAPQEGRTLEGPYKCRHKDLCVIPALAFALNRTFFEPQFPHL